MWVCWGRFELTNDSIIKPIHNLFLWEKFVFILVIVLVFFKECIGKLIRRKLNSLSVKVFGWKVYFLNPSQCMYNRYNGIESSTYVFPLTFLIQTQHSFLQIRKPEVSIQTIDYSTKLSCQIRKCSHWAGGVDSACHYIFQPLFCNHTKSQKACCDIVKSSFSMDQETFS